MASELTTNSRAFIATVVLFAASAHAQLIFDCPDEWESDGEFCYKFVSDFPLKFDDAAASCSVDGASLLYVDSSAEHTYLRNRLEAGNTFQMTWLTSGHGRKDDDQVDGGEVTYWWQATSLPIADTLQFWLPGQPDPAFDVDTGVIAYTFGVSSYGWGVVSEGEKNAYICKIPKAESYRIVQTARDYDYGMDIEDASMVDKGPHFLVKPNSLVVVGDTREPAVLECLADGKPEPTYKWFRGRNLTEEVTSDTNSRYTLTNGRLLIYNPDERLDAGDYRCEVSNKYGTIISGTVSISFGFMGEFSNVQNAPVNAYAYDGVSIQCSPLLFKPAARYQWIKGQTQFIRPEYEDYIYIFVSHNGNIYFSEVTRNDEGDYTCIAMLEGLSKHTIGTSQTPVRVSLPIPLVVMDQSPKSNWGPEIQNDFPAVFPNPPLRGQDVRIECFAYGSTTTPFHYSWRREGKPMPSKAVADKKSHHRVLLIPDAQLEDSGTYTCSVMRSTSSRDSRSVHLSLGARPYFVAQLKDQHADVGSQLSWHCDARANPAPTYRWFKNGRLLESNEETRIQVSRNVLTITNLDAKMHNGMYQCGAFNSHGMETSNAELRVLSFPPTFRKYPLPQQVTGAIGGDITIVCNPEGSPFPVITWAKNGGALAIDGSRVSQLANGNLILRDLVQGDVGTYTCSAENINGKDSSSTRLALATGATIAVGPTTKDEVVNTTAFLPCQASRDPNMDMTYVWYFNGHLIDTDQPEYTKLDTAPGGLTGLYVKGLSFENEGMYRCVVRTPFAEDFKEAYLTVKGPPGMVGGVKGDQKSATQYGVTVHWSSGANHGSPVISYTIAAQDEFNEDVWTAMKTVRAQDAVQANNQADVGRLQMDIDGLNPGTLYRFSVIASNQYGAGSPSLPSPYVRTADAPPAIAPRNVRGGGGKVGDLTMEWDPLTRAEWGSNSITYNLYWRKKTDGLEESTWIPVLGLNGVTKYVTLVGKDNFYLLYQVKVQAVNSFGKGPNSTKVDIYSAEGMPVATPTNVQSNTFNSTALEVSWEPVADTRETVKGRVQGYQINYWPEFMLASDYPRFLRYYGQVDNGMVIGLEVDVNTWVDVQVFNTAGLGPRSEAYIMETSGDAPLTYPQEVRVYSAGPNSARVWFRGISIITDEEGMSGYVIYYWNANENARTAVMVELSLHTTDYVLTGLDESVVYALRVAGVNGGGYGRKSPTHYFTYQGSVYIGYQLSQTIDVFMAPAAVPRPSVQLLSLLLLLTGPLSRLS